MSEWKEQLVAGYRAFRAMDFPEQMTLYETLGTQGQSPKIMLIACADSRVDPTDIFNAYPGEMFVARNVANIVPPHKGDQTLHETMAAIEYAVSELKVEVIIVMGHESCGGVKGCLDGLGDPPHTSFVAQWVSLLNEARDRVVARDISKSQQQFELELEGVRQSLDNLMTYDFVKDAVNLGRLKLQGAYFSIEKAELRLADEDGVFETVEA